MSTRYNLPPGPQKRRYLERLEKERQIEELRELARELARGLAGSVQWLDNIAAGNGLIAARAASVQVALGMPNNVPGREAMREMIARAKAAGLLEE